ncbi:MAG: beta-ketoacyl-[Bacteroidales bacterium]|nr:beta-ketoacyl-[acyl-carrier-protein] synthase family protein [Bacteroidales bacterium]
MNPSNLSNPIIVSGYGVVSAIGVGKEQTLASLREHRSGIAPVQYLATVHRDMLVGEVKLSFDELMERVGVPSDAEAPQSRTALIGRLALREALQQAALTTPDDYARTALISGTTVGGMDRTEIEASVTPDGQIVHYNYDCGTSTLDIARGFGQFAFVDTISTACSSAANAIGMAVELVRQGHFERVVAGGSEGLSRLHLNGFNTLMILDQQPCRPFDAQRNGINLGEGAAYLVIESEASALRRGVKPLAVVRGFGNACDAYHQTASSPDGEGAVLAMRRALDDAHLQPSDITYINCHGTGTPNNDVSELNALHRVFGDVLPPFSSTKGFTGHTTSASGSIEAAFCLLALQHHFLPVNLNFQTPIDHDYPVLPNAAEQVIPLSRGRRGGLLLNSFAFGGNDSSLILSPYTEPQTPQTLQTPQTPPQAASPQTPTRKVYLLAQTLLAPSVDPNFRDYLAPLESRRFDKLLKRTLCCSLETLRQYPDLVPDAIITATVWGSAISAISFFHDMMRQGEAFLKPTLFMQSTHNTMSSLIAIQTHNHGYNNTHSQLSDSLPHALLDAWLQMQSGRVHSALVGIHDSIPAFDNRSYLLVTADALPPDCHPLAEFTSYSELALLAVKNG